MENTRNHDRDLSRTEIEFAIDEWIIGKNAERDRKVLRRRLIDGVTFERLAEEQELSVSQVKRIIWKNAEIIFRHLKMN
jgi:DNA-directed RNA polymerase specialized sigma subunit